MSRTVQQLTPTPDDLKNYGRKGRGSGRKGGRKSGKSKSRGGRK